MPAVFQPCIATSLAIATALRYSKLGCARFLLNTTELQATTNYGVAGTFSKLRVYISVNTSATGEFRIKVNGSNGNSLVSVGSGLTGVFQDLSNTDTIDADDTVVISSIRTGTALTALNVGAVFTPTDTDINYVRYITDNISIAVDSTLYIALNSSGTSSAESNAQSVIAGSATFKNLYARITANISDTATTINSRKNTSAGNLTVSIPTLMTGVFEDTSNNDSVVEDDLYCLQIINPSLITSIACRLIAIGCESDADNYQYTAGISITNIDQGTTRYSTIGANFNNQATEAFASIPNYIDGVASLFGAYIELNNLDVSTAVSFYKNGSAGNQTFSVPSNTTGRYEDAVNEDAMAVDDLMSLGVVIGAGTGFMTLARSQVLIAQEVAVPEISRSFIGLVI